MKEYLQKLITQGEGVQLDFKNEISDSFKIAKSIVSFANVSGGILLIGVADNGKLVGIDNEEEIYMLNLAVINYVKPNLSLEYVKHKSSKGRIILECKVPKGDQPPYMAKDLNGKWMAYARYEDQCKKLSPVRFFMLQSNSELMEGHIYSENEIKVIDILKKAPEGLPKNQLIKRISVGYKEGLKTLANLLKCRVIKEIDSSNCWLYKLV